MTNSPGWPVRGENRRRRILQKKRKPRPVRNKSYQDKKKRKLKKLKDSSGRYAEWMVHAAYGRVYLEDWLTYKAGECEVYLVRCTLYWLRKLTQYTARHGCIVRIMFRTSSRHPPYSTLSAPLRKVTGLRIRSEFRVRTKFKGVATYRTYGVTRSSKPKRHYG